MKVKTQIIIILLIFSCMAIACSKGKSGRSDRNDRVPPLVTGTEPIDSEFISVGGSAKKARR